MFDSGMRHAKVTLAKPNVHAAHPFRDADNHDSLLTYCQQRLQQGREQRDNRVIRYAQIDRDVAGWMRLSDDDKQPLIKQERDGTPAATTVNLPLTWVHLDDMMTYFAQTFSPNRGMFYQTGTPDEVGPANQIITVMNNHAIYGGYYRQVLLASFSSLKYNIGGYKIVWSQDTGPKLSQPGAGDIQVTQDIIWAGNKCESLDMYNTMWDPSVHPTQVYKEAEWAATVTIKSHYWLANKCVNGMYFNCDEALKDDSGVGSATYYKDPPTEARLSNVSSNGTD